MDLSDRFTEEAIAQHLAEGSDEDDSVDHDMTTEARVGEISPITSNFMTPHPELYSIPPAARKFSRLKIQRESARKARRGAGAGPNLRSGAGEAMVISKGGPNHLSD